MNEIGSKRAGRRSAPELAGRTKSSIAIERLRAEIINGHLKPNEKLRIQALAERYQLGPSPLREALSRLVTDGLVEAEDQRGFRVCPVSREDLVDLTRTRVGIECMALTASIAQGDVAWESDILAALHRLSRCPPLPSPNVGSPADSKWVACHLAFHRALIAGCRSDWLLYFCGLLYEQSERYRILAEYSVARKSRNVPQEHEEIMRAVIGRDVDSACELIKQHFWATTNIILDDEKLFAPMDHRTQNAEIPPGAANAPAPRC